MADGTMPAATVAEAISATQPGQIHALMAQILGEIDCIKKEKTNAGQGFRFRGIDDVYAALHKILAKFRVYCMPSVISHQHEERKSAKGNPQMWVVVHMQYTFFAPDGSSVSASTLGEAIDQGDKSAGKAQSYAHKICLLQTFCIPTEESDDPDAHSPRLGTRAGRSSQQSSAPPPGATEPPADLRPEALYIGTDEQKKRFAKLAKDLCEKHGAPKLEKPQLIDLSNKVVAEKLTMVKLEIHLPTLLASHLRPASA